MTEPRNQTVIELTGERGSGKTCIATLLGEALSPAGILFIDASADQALTTSMAPTPPTLLLSALFGPEGHAPGSREAIDWTFHDLTISVGEESDLLTVGALPDDLAALDREKLRYGLNRLIAPYEHIIVDGLHPVIHSVLPEESIRILHVLRPEHFPNWRLPIVDETALHTPALLLNGYSGEPLPNALEKALLKGQIQLIGKIPRYETPQDCLNRMPADFQDGLLRLDIPLSPHARG